METGVSETVTRFIVVERLVLRAFVPAGLGEVVTVRFAVGYRERDERVVAVLLEVNARLGVEEVQCLSTFTWSPALSSLPLIV